MNSRKSSLEAKRDGQIPLRMAKILITMAPLFDGQIGDIPLSFSKVLHSVHYTPSIHNKPFRINGSPNYSISKLIDAKEAPPLYYQFSLLPYSSAGCFTFPLI